MKLLIDNREPPQIVKYIQALNRENGEKIIIEVKTLDIGDYIFYDDISHVEKVIIERKSLSDLESSIKDGRYNEQSFRLDKSQIHNHNIIYLIEGNIQTYKNSNFKNTIYSSLFSLNYYKGFSIICSHNQIETGEILFNFINKLYREKNKPSFYTSIELNNEKLDTENGDKDSGNYLENIKTSKKSQITVDNIFQLMLMQIPGISNVTANAISEKFTNMENLLQSLKDNTGELENLKLSTGRKISKKIIDSVKIYLLI